MTSFNLVAKYVGCVALTMFGVLAVVACSSDSKDSCSKLESLCSSTTTTDGGGTASISVKCDADKLDDLSNADEVNDCIKGASTCAVATGCLLKARP